jgi:hypothetical protein
LKNKQFEEAILAYEQCYFELIDNDSDSLSADIKAWQKNECLLKKVYGQKAAGQFDEAVKTVQRFDFNNLSDTSQFLFRYEAVVCTFLADMYEDCYTNIQQLKYFVKDSTLTQKALLWEILALTKLARYNEAKPLLVEYAQQHHLIVNVDDVFAFAQKPRFRSVKKAETLATFIPGAGMLYSGNTAEGIISLVFQAATLGFGIYSVVDGYYFSGFFTGFGLFQAFYFGGVRRSGVLAQQKNEQLKQRYYQQVKNALVK